MKQNIKLRVTDLCEANPPMTDAFPSQRASRVDNVYIWLRHHVCLPIRKQQLLGLLPFHYDDYMIK